MAKATLSADTLTAANISITSFSAKLDSLFTLAGGALYDSYNGGNYYGFIPIHKVYKIQINSDPTYGYLYVDFYVNYDYTTYYTLFTDWDLTNHVGINGYRQIRTNSYSSISDITFNAVYGQDSSERYLFIFIRQGTTISIIGYVQPGNPKAWVKPSSYFILSPTDAGFSRWQGMNVHPFGVGNADYNCLIGNQTMPSYSNPFNNDFRDSFSNIYFFHGSDQGTPGRLSSDFALGAFTGVPVLKTITDNNTQQRMLVLSTGRAGLAVALA